MPNIARQQLASLNGELVVSCQAREANPLHGPVFMAAMAAAAVLGGAAGIRADGVEDIEAIANAVGPDVPIMGIFKVKMPDGSLFITPTAESARNVIAAGANLVAVDGTLVIDGTILARHIAANAITSAEIAAGGIDADRLNVTALTAITANFGDATVTGSLTGGPTGKLNINFTTGRIRGTA